jgi:hypothetical protein
MRARLTKLAAALAALTALAIGGSTLASATSNTTSDTPAPAVEQEKGTGGEANEASKPAEGDADAAAQAAACEAAGIVGDNVNYDDETGTCSLDNGADAEEADSESGAESDGPGGYEDTNQNADTQQEGEH